MDDAPGTDVFPIRDKEWRVDLVRPLAYRYCAEAGREFSNDNLELAILDGTELTIALNSYADAARHIQEIRMRKIEPSMVYLESQFHLYPAVAEQIDDISRLCVIPACAVAPLASQTNGFPHDRTQSLATLENIWNDIRSLKAFASDLGESPKRERIEFIHSHTVMKRYPDMSSIQICRAISDLRRVHLRVNKCDTPTAYAPSASQIFGRILATKTRYREIYFLLSKRDISSAFGRIPARRDCARVFAHAVDATDL